MLISLPIELRERIDTEDLLCIGNGVAVLASQCRRKFLTRETNGGRMDVLLLPSWHDMRETEWVLALNRSENSGLDSAEYVRVGAGIN